RPCRLARSSALPSDGAQSKVTSSNAGRKELDDEFNAAVGLQPSRGWYPGSSVSRLDTTEICRNLEAAFIAGSNSTAALLSEVNYGECLLDTGAGEGKIGASVKQTLKNALTPVLTAHSPVSLSDREYRPNTPPN